MSEKKNKNFWGYSNEILSLAMPLIVSQIAILGIGVTDIYMAGQLDAETLAAVQLSISIWNMISLTVIGFMVANSPIIGEFWGSSKYSSVKNQFQQCLWLSLPISVLIIIALSIGIYSLKNLSISAKVARIILSPGFALWAAAPFTQIIPFSSPSYSIMYVVNLVP